MVLATSLAGADADEIAMLAADDDGAWLVATPRLPLLADGAGDLAAALFLGYWLRRRDASSALGDSASTSSRRLADQRRAEQRTAKEGSLEVLKAGCGRQLVEWKIGSSERRKVEL